MYRDVAWLFWILTAIIRLGAGTDVPYVFGDSGLQPLEYAYIADYDETELLVFSTTGGPGVSGVGGVRTIRDLKEELSEKVDVTDPSTRETAVVLAAKYPGDRTIDQICSIYEYLKQGWKYVGDPSGIDYYQSASQSIKIGERINCAGAGDCDDFAILMSALIDSIGGTTRIVLAYNRSYGHAYAEVYIGRLDVSDHCVENVVDWLKSKYNTKEIFTHIDHNNKDVWLNLDWSTNYPGGPFYEAEKQVVLSVRGENEKFPLNVNISTISRQINSLPTLIEIDSDKDSPQTAGSSIEFTALVSDSDSDNIYYKFWLKGPIPSEELRLMQDWGTNNYWDWTPSQEGSYEIIVGIRDGQHARSDGCDSINTVSFTINPTSMANQPPVVNSLMAGVGTNVVTFTAIAADPDSDDQILYKFFVKGPSTGYVWQPVGDWTTESEAWWMAFQEGDHMVQVWVRDGHHAGPDGSDSIRIAYFTVRTYPSVGSNEEWAARGSGKMGRPANK